MIPIGQAIYSWRIAKGLTQDRVSRDSGVSRPNLSAIEQGSRDLTVQTLRRVAAALGVRPGVLVDGEPPKGQAGGRLLNRFAMDRIARLAAGQRLRAPRWEKTLADRLYFIMKSKIGIPKVKGRRTRNAKAEIKTLMQLKAELGPETLNHLIRRVEKALPMRRL